MISDLVRACGAFVVPQALLSMLVLALLVAYLLEALGGRPKGGGAAPWRVTLEPLGGIAVSLGLLGSVVGFIGSFGGFSGPLRTERVAEGLGLAYYPTAWGIVTALLASGGVYALDVLHRRRMERAT
jgi:hypothetical protein